MTYADGALTIKGEKNAETEETKSGYHVSERSYGSFFRALTIDDVNADKIEAKFDKGVLPTAQAKSKRIEVKAGK